MRNALARFDPIEGVSDDERAAAFANIRRAAEHYGVDVSETSWQELAPRPGARSAAKSKRKATSKKTTSKKTTAKKATAKKATAKKATAKKKRSPANAASVAKPTEKRAAPERRTRAR